MALANTIVCCFLLSLGFVWSADDYLREEWMLVRLQGQPIGHYHRTTRDLPAKTGRRILTETVQELKFKRMGTELTMRTAQRVIENENGTVLNFEHWQQQGEKPNVTRGYRENDRMIVYTRGVEERYSIPKTTLGPYALEERSRTQTLRAGLKVEQEAFLSDFPQKPVRIRWEVAGRESRTLLSGSESLWKVRTTYDVLPGVSMESWANDQGVTLATLLPFGGFGELEMLVCTAAEAQGPHLGQEIYTPSLITPSRSLGNYRRWQTATYRLTGLGSLQPVTGEEQNIRSLADSRTEVNVRVPAYADESISWRLPAEFTPELQPYLVAGPYLELDDKGIQLMAKEALAGERHPLRAARRIEDYVRRYITRKDLSVGFASAAETVTSRAGDCTEHAVLAAALGRAQGLPTRLVIGLAYSPPPGESSGEEAKGVFGFHMWAEAYLGPQQWVAMDPSLGGFDVGHIALVKTDLGASTSSSALYVPIMQMTGQVQIEVVTTE